MRIPYTPDSEAGKTLEARARSVGRSFDFRLTVDFVLAQSESSGGVVVWDAPGDADAGTPRSADDRRGD